MRTVALISEFNPFHNGHKYCLDAIRAQCGDDTCIIALMGGNYTQRGEGAVADKLVRAAAAVEGGVDLVLELPFPYSIASAEFFATAGVRLAASLGIVDTLAFGSECGSIEPLLRIATRLSSQEFTDAFLCAVRLHPEKGHASLTEEVYASLYGDEEASLLTHPNNTLGIEYLRANLSLAQPLSVMTVKRQGEYHSTSLQDGISASALRRIMLAGDGAWRDGMPAASVRIWEDAMKEGRAPVAPERFGALLLSHFRLAKPHDLDDLGYRIREAAVRAATYEDFITLVATKRYSHAHLRRAIWHRYFGITSADLAAPPAYTQVLGMNAVGRRALRAASTRATVEILTKPGDARALSKEAARQALFAQQADLIYPLAMPKPAVGNTALLAFPFCKE